MQKVAALYQRVSDGTDKSVEDQNKANEEAARDQGWATVTFSDSVSASRFSRKARPEWAELTAAVAEGRFAYVVLWEVSRADRKQAPWMAFLDACRETGTGIYVTGRDRLFDLSNGYDRRDLDAEGIDAAFESEKISKRSRRGVAGAVAMGLPTGRIPYGYRRTYTAAPGRRRPLQHQEPDPNEAPVVREIVARLARGEAITAIERDLDRRKIRTRAGARWSHSSIARLVNEGYVYLGKRKGKDGLLIDGNWPPLVEADVFRKAHAVLADPARRTAALARGGIRPGAARWLLSYLARCGVCGGPLNARLIPRAGGKVPVYRCADGCVSAPVALLDRLATVGVVGFCAQSPLFELLTRTDDREAQSAREEAEAERDRLAEFEDKAASGDISAPSFARIAAKIEARIAELEARALELSVPPALRDLASSAATKEERWADIYRRWTDMPLSTRRSVIKAIFSPVLDSVPRGGDALDPNRFRMPPNPAILR